MTPGGVRHLAAIMFTDIVGYTVLMQSDEAEAKAVRARHSGVLKASISDHGGRLLQSFGDGTLSVFPSAVEAVACAVEIQRDLQTYPKIPLRIGIHVGDIAYDDQGVYGDAVNVASRLESIGTAGSVVVSGKVAEELKNHTRFATVPLGEVRLKNVQRPVALHAVAAEGIKIPERNEIREAAPGEPETRSAADAGSSPLDRPEKRRVAPWVLALAVALAGWLALQLFVLGGESGESVPPTATGQRERPSIAVLPFDNLSPDPDNAYFAAGMHEQLISQLSKVSTLLVISRTSVMRYAEDRKNATEIAAELGVDFILEGSARRDRDRVRLTTQLIDGQTDEHLWAEDYDRDLSVADLFEIQDDVANRVASSLSTIIQPQEARRIAEPPTQHLEAFDHYLRGLLSLHGSTEADFREALEHFEEALRVDPDYALAWAGIGLAYWQFADLLLSPHDAFPLALAAADSALARDPDLPEALLVRGTVRITYEWDLEAGRSDLDRAAAPEHSLTHYAYFNYWTALGDLESACAATERAVAVDPLNPLGRVVRAWCALGTGDYQTVIDQHQRILEIDPGFVAMDRSVGYALAALGRHEEAVESFEETERLIGGPSAFYAAYLASQGRRDEALQRVLSLEARYAAGTYIVPELMAVPYAALGDHDKALEWLEQGMVARSSGALVVRLDLQLKPVLATPEYRQLVEKYGLPVVLDPN
jgi:TolB-like protein/class 3 adenylate cyclase